MSHLAAILKKQDNAFHAVVPFDAGRDILFPFDFTEHNTSLAAEEIADTERFATWINRTLRQHQARYGIGGYGEHRTLYARSRHFGGQGEPRRLHLGIDIWGPAGTKVMAPLDGLVHSFGFNNNDSDYGATMILTHNLDGTAFHTLY